MPVSITKKFPWSGKRAQKGSERAIPKTSSKAPLGGTTPSSALRQPRATLDPVLVSADWSDVSDDSEVDEEVFDTPELSIDSSCTHDSFSTTTPLTPPTTSTVKVDTPSPCIPGPTAGQTIFDAIAARNPAAKAETDDAIKERTDNSVKEEVDYFQPKKLSRNLTAEFKAITEANAQVAGPAFSAQPVFEFSKHRRLATNTANVTTRPGPHSEALSAPHVSKVRPSIKLGTCHSHDSDQTRSSLFVHSEVVKKFGEDLEFIVPYDVSQRLSEDRTKCIGTKVKDRGTRCGYSAKGLGLEVGPRLQALKDACSRRDYTTVLNCIDEFARVAMCGTHYNGVRSAKRIGKLRKFIEALPNAPTDKVKVFHFWLDKLSSTTSDVGTATIKENSLKGNYSRSSSTFRSTDSAVLSRTTSPSFQRQTRISLGASNIHFQPYQPQKTKGVPTSSALRNALESPLTPTDRNRGFIYMFWHAGQFGRMKIGHSANIEKRLQEWNKQCDRDHEFHKPSYDGELVEVPHVRRVETLMHVELKDFRRSMKCGGCGVVHREWFEIKEHEAVAVFMKWRRWIETYPYEQCADGEWRLSRSAREELDEVCEPVSFADKVSNVVKQRQRRRSLRYNPRPRR